jgi:CHC2 zinc finger
MRLEPRPKQSLIKPSESYHSPKVLARRKTSRMDKPNIIEVIGQYVELHKMGREYVGLCPFHAERTPSFSVNLEKQLFHCFGCGEGGSVFDFVMEMENCDFKTAVKNLGLQTYRPSPQGLLAARKPNELLGGRATYRTNFVMRCLRLAIRSVFAA